MARKGLTAFISLFARGIPGESVSGPTFRA